MADYLTTEKDIKYKSLYSEKLITLPQWLLEIMHKANGVSDLSEFLRDDKNKQDYRRDITIVNRLLKTYAADDIYKVLMSKKPKAAPLLHWWVKKECLSFSAKKSTVNMQDSGQKKDHTEQIKSAQQYNRMPNKNILSIIRDKYGEEKE